MSQARYAGSQRAHRLRSIGTTLLIWAGALAACRGASPWPFEPTGRSADHDLILERR